MGTTPVPTEAKDGAVTLCFTAQIASFIWLDNLDDDAVLLLSATED